MKAIYWALTRGKRPNSPFGIIASPLFNGSLCSSACLCQIILATSIPTALMPHGIYEESGLNVTQQGRTRLEVTIVDERHCYKTA